MTEMTHRTAQSNSDQDTPAIDWEKAREGTRLMLEAVGEDPDRSGLEDTWHRRVPETLATLTAGTRDSEKPTMRTFEAPDAGTVIKTEIPLYSLCEHHLLPYHGVAHVAYIPDDAVVGLSKLPRYVRWQSRRLTMQEALTQDIATGLHEEIGANGVIVETRATHLCEAMRGVERATETTTRAVSGSVSEAVVRRFEQAIDRSSRQ